MQYEKELKRLELHKSSKKAKILNKCWHVIQRDWLNIQIQTCIMLAWSRDGSRDRSRDMATYLHANMAGHVTRLSLVA